MGRNNDDVDIESAGPREVLGPEELLRRETKAVNFSRALFIVLLIVVGGLLSAGSYKWESHSEQKAYRKAFESISSKVTDSFLLVVTQTMWNAYAVGMAVSASSASSSDSVQQQQQQQQGVVAPNITMSLFGNLAAGVTTQAAGAGNVLWSPLIQDEASKQIWQAYAQQQMNDASRSDHKCFPCGGPNVTVGTPEVAVTTPIGTYTCAELITETLRGGSTLSNDCHLLAPYIQANCNCRPSNTTTERSGDQQDTVVSLPRSRQIYKVVDEEVLPVEGPGPFAPVWQVYPAREWASAAMFDLFSDPISGGALHAMLRTQEAVMSEIYTVQGTPNSSSSKVRSLMFSPVVAATQDNKNPIIGSIVLDIDWAHLLSGALPPDNKGLLIVVENNHGQKYSFKTDDDNSVNVMGEGDLHDTAFTSMMMKQSSFDDYIKVQNYGAPFGTGETSALNCAYRITVYASNEFRSSYISSKPIVNAAAVILTFVFMAFVLVAYDCFVAKRFKKAMTAALQRDEIVSSLFPAGVQERLFQRSQSSRRGSLGKKNPCMHTPQLRNQLRKVMSVSSLSVTSTTTDTLSGPEAIADYFPSVTVVFADISGFTAWSSERQPSEVFHLLETVYQTFDKIAERFGVFKIETIGDCYVAVAGLPNYQPDHAVRIVRFAYECTLHMHELIKDLQSSLGSTTSALSIRIGIHSGPVIAGVLRGEKSRFQLFGDTMNTTSRMQTTGEINKIQISESTADLLIQARKSHWIRPREKPVAMKGKGLVQTYWVDPVFSEDKLDAEKQGADISCLLVNGNLAQSSDDKMSNMVEWKTDLLLRLCAKIVARRELSRKRRSSIVNLTRRNSMTNYRTPFEDVAEIIPMEGFLEKAVLQESNHEATDLGQTVRAQLENFVLALACKYRDNPFHNFEHAIYVATSAEKIVQRLVQPEGDNSPASSRECIALKRANHNNTFGISSDMLAQFAIVFAAFTHGIGHTGVSNTQLAQEGDELALRYNNQCVAQQNAVDIAWNLFIEERFTELRQCICQNEQEQQRFRQLVVNAMIATNLTEDDLQQQRQKRWEFAFQDSRDWHSDSLDSKAEMDRKATVVFEYIVQASVAAHTMDTWNVYTHWNEQLFQERYLAFLSGREEQDPSIGWYLGELSMFDTCIIPLAKRLETCGVFGASSSKFLSHAFENRRKWEAKGEALMQRWIKQYSA